MIVGRGDAGTRGRGDAGDAGEAGARDFRFSERPHRLAELTMRGVPGQARSAFAQVASPVLPMS
jgi:hypothetical protein